MKTLKSSNYPVKTYEASSEALKQVSAAAKASYDFEAIVPGGWATHPALLTSYWNRMETIDNSLNTINNN